MSSCIKYISLFKLKKSIRKVCTIDDMDRSVLDTRSHGGVSSEK